MPDNFTSYLRPNLSPASCPNNAIASNGASSNLQKCRIKHFFINRFPLKERLQHIFRVQKSLFGAKSSFQKSPFGANSQLKNNHFLTVAMATAYQINTRHRHSHVLRGLSRY